MVQQPLRLETYAALLAGIGIKVELVRSGGFIARTNFRKVEVSLTLVEQAREKGNLNKVMGLVFHEVLHILHTDPEKMTGSETRMFRVVANILEDIRIEKAGIHGLPGGTQRLAETMDALMRENSESFFPPKEERPPQERGLDLINVLMPYLRHRVLRQETQACASAWEDRCLKWVDPVKLETLKDLAAEVRFISGGKSEYPKVRVLTQRVLNLIDQILDESQNQDQGQDQNQDQDQDQGESQGQGQDQGEKHRHCFSRTG